MQPLPRFVCASMLCLRPLTSACKQKLSQLRPSFQQDGTTTAGNSSQVSDGAAAVLLARRSVAKAKGLPILARFRGFAVAGVPPAIMGIGPAVAIPKVRSSGCCWGCNPCVDGLVMVEGSWTCLTPVLVSSHGNMPLGLEASGADGWRHRRVRAERSLCQPSSVLYQEVGPGCSQGQPQRRCHCAGTPSRLHRGSTGKEVTSAIVALRDGLYIRCVHVFGRVSDL